MTFSLVGALQLECVPSWFIHGHTDYQCNTTVTTMTEALARKKKVRGGHRSSASRTITQIYEALESTTGIETNLTKLTQCKLALEEKLEIVKHFDSEILELVSEDKVESEIEQADVFGERVQRAVIDANNAISTQDKSTDPTPASLRVPSPRSPQPTHSSLATKVKLPKLTLKKFSGDLTKWATFWDSFESSIDQSTEISNVDKFNYLNSLLEGSAAEAISGLKLTAANYGEAITILKR